MFVTEDGTPPKSLEEGKELSVVTTGVNNEGLITKRVVIDVQGVDFSSPLPGVESDGLLAVLVVGDQVPVEIFRRVNPSVDEVGEALEDDVVVASESEVDGNVVVWHSTMRG